MDDSDRFDHDFERACWAEAVQNFKNDRICDNKKDQQKLDLFLQEWERPDDVQQFCRSTKAKAPQEYSSKLGRILEKIELAMSVGDIAMKGAPESVGLAWMGIRLCLSSISEDYATFEIFSQACLDISGIMISCAVFARMYGPTRNIDGIDTKGIHARIVERIPRVYTEILDFAFEVKRYQAERKAIRLTKGFIRPPTERFTKRLKSMRDHDDQMSKYATIASQQLTDYYQELGLQSNATVLASLKSIKIQLDQNTKLRQEQAEDMRSFLIQMTQKLTPHVIALNNFEKNFAALGADNDQKRDFETKLARRSPPQTCTWILKHVLFEEWLHADGSAVLWVSGGGGFGKSVLMAAIIDHLGSRLVEIGNMSVINYFFCNTGDDATKKTDRILKHLLSQVYDPLKGHSTETVDKANKLVSAYLSSGDGSSQNEVSWGSRFVETYHSLVTLLGSSVILVIDALDECLDRSDGFIKVLREVSSGATDIAIKLIVSSRPEPDIESELSGSPVIAVEHNNAPDIRLSAERELALIPGWTAQERKLACDRVALQAGSYFRYVDLALDFLRQPWQRPLGPHLEQLPKGINALYEQIIQRTPPAYFELLKTSLTWTILAGGSIRVPEVMDAYSCTYSAGTGSVGEYDVDSVPDEAPEYDPELYINQIRTAGSNLLLVDPSSLVIQQRHSTVAEFFLSRMFDDKQEMVGSGPRCIGCQKSIAVTRSFELTEKGGHLIIATSILKHLMCEDFRRRYLVPHEIDPAKHPVLRAHKAAQESDGSSSGGKDGPSFRQPQTGVKNGGRDDETMKITVSVAPPESIPHVEPTLPTEQHSRPHQDPGQTIVTNGAETASVYEDSDFDEYEPQLYNYGVFRKSKEYRYEVDYCSYHLRRVEELLEPEDRCGARWEEFAALRSAFFNDNRLHFQSWINLMAQRRSGHGDPTTALHCAAAFGLSSLLLQLIHDGGDIHSFDGLGHSALFYAIHYYRGARASHAEHGNSLRPMEILLQAGVDPNVVGGSGSFLLLRSLLVGNPCLDAVELFLKYGAKAGAVNLGSKLSALHTCCSFCNDPAVLKALLSHGADPNVKDDRELTPLHHLMTRGKIPQHFVKLLLEAGADVNAEDSSSQRPLYILCSTSGDEDTARLLIKHQADVMDVDDIGATALHLACRRGHTNLVQLLIDSRGDISALDKKGRSPFFMACCADTDETAVHLTETIAEPYSYILTVPTKDGKTPIRKAAAKGHERVVRLLFERLGSDSTILNEQDPKYMLTALHVAARNGHEAVVEYLVRHGARGDIQDANGHSALSMCINSWVSTTHSFEACCALLLDTNPHLATEAGVLQGLAAKGNVTLLKKAVDYGADPLQLDRHGWTAIQVAQHCGEAEAAELLASQHITSGLRPSRLKNVLPKITTLSNEGLDFILTSRSRTGAVIADHPILPSTAGFYFEAFVHPLDPETSSKRFGGLVNVSIGVCSHASPRRPGWQPGFQPYHSWAYHGWDGSLQHYPSQHTEMRQLPAFLPGDVAGCGLDLKNNAVFFTRNGELLSVVQTSQPSTYYAYNSMMGRLYPAFGADCTPVTVTVNFGNDKSKPFKWDPGNLADCGVAFVREQEEKLAQVPLKGQRTVY